MFENRKFKNVLEVIPDKNVTSFTKWYNSMRRPIREFHLKNIVRKSVEVGFTEGVRILVNENGMSCLSLGRASSVFHLACEYEQIEIVKFLLTLDICDTFFQRVNFINMDGLAIAAEKRNENFFNVLLANDKFDLENMPFANVPRLFNALGRGDLDVHEQTGKSVLQLAIESRADRCTVKEILSYIANIVRKDKHGNTALSNIGWKDKHGNTALSSLKTIGL